MASIQTPPTYRARLQDVEILSVRFGASLSPHPSTFSPLLYAGRLAEGLEALSRCGFAAVEISLRKAEDVDIHWLDERLSAHGLVVSAFATGRVCLEDSLCLCDTNHFVQQQLQERFEAFIHMAAHFNASVIIGGVRGRFLGDEQQRTAQRQAAIETLSSCAATAGSLGVNLLVEPINRYETNFINTAAEGLEFIEAIGHPCVKLLLDTFHMNIEEIDPCATIRKVGQHLGYVHFADSNRQAPGRGHINFQAIINALVEIRYQGFITAEILPIPNDAQALSLTGKFFHSLLNLTQKDNKK